MIKSYVLIALRNLKKQKVFSIINILGMAVGMAGFTLFAHMAGVKLNSDKFHLNADRIVGVVQVLTTENQEEVHTTNVPAPMGTALAEEFPEIEDMVRMLPAGRLTFQQGDDHFSENHILFVDPGFLDVFSFPMAAGDPKKALAAPDSIVLTEAKVLKYFGDEDPIGQVLTLDQDINVTVTGVVKNIPRTSSIRFEFLVSMPTARKINAEMEDWSSHRHTTLLLLPPGFDHRALEVKLPAFMDKYYTDTYDSPKQLYLFPFLDFRLKSNHITSFIAGSHPASVIIMFAVGILLLLVVCINFINLSTARYMHRTKEIGLRKVVGASRPRLIRQFLGESIILSFLALPAAVILYELLHPILTSYLGDFSLLSYTHQVSNSIWNYPFLIQYMVIAALLTGVLSGTYPALLLSSFKPAQVLKGSIKTGRKKRRGSKLMIIFQFFFSIIFILSAGIINQQFDNLIRADMGFKRDQIAMVRVPAEARPKIELLKTEFSRNPDIKTISAAVNIPIVWDSQHPAKPVGAADEEALNMDMYGVDYDFVKLMGMELKAGRSFSREAGDGESFILNETAAKKLEWDSPLGKQLTIGDRTGTVIGITEDFVFSDIGFGIHPAALYLEKENLNFLMMKYSAEDRYPALRDFLQEKWASIFPDTPFTCFTLDYYFSSVMGLLDKIAGFLNSIGIIAVIFSSLGLLGLAFFVIERRTKEIGIRKILGASLPNVTWVVIKEFIILVAIADVIALVLAYFGWHKVMQTGLLFINNISAGTYIYAVTITILAALAAVLSQTLKITRKNPVDSLRFE